MNVLRRLWQDETGGPLLEYAVAFALFAAGFAWMFALVAVNANSRYQATTSTMTQIQTSPLPTGPLP